jgi:hypothetical protein
MPVVSWIKFNSNSIQFNSMIKLLKGLWVGFVLRFYPVHKINGNDMSFLTKNANIIFLFSETRGKISELRYNFIIHIENMSNIHMWTRKARYELKSNTHRYKLWIQVNTIPVFYEWSIFSIWRWTWPTVCKCSKFVGLWLDNHTEEGTWSWGWLLWPLTVRPMASSRFCANDLVTLI